MRLNAIDWIALVLVIVGGVNWGLVGLFDFNLVDSLFGQMSALSRIIYALVGLSALYLIYTAVKLSSARTARAVQYKKLLNTHRVSRRVFYFCGVVVAMSEFLSRCFYNDFACTEVIFVDNIILQLTQKPLTDIY